MARQVLGALTTLNLATNLDPMFSELYTATDYLATTTFTIGNGATGTKQIILDGPTATGVGAVMRFRRAGVDSMVLGTAGAVLGGVEAGDGVIVQNGNTNLRFYTNSVERMRIDGAGNIAIGTNAAIAKIDISTSVPTAGSLGIRINDATLGAALQLMRTGATYSYAGVGANEGWLYSQGSTTLNIGPDGAGMVRFVSNGAARMAISAAGVVTPGADNTQTLGSSGLRWSTVYAGTGTINTSDAREKTEVEELTDDELIAAIALGREIGAFKFLSSVAEKSDGARTHVGMTVQRAIEIMRANDLDPFGYAFICHDEWDATDTTEAGDRYGFRMDQLLAFIMRGYIERQDRIEIRLTDLEK